MIREDLIEELLPSVRESILPIAKRFHKGQKRSNGEPYLNHLLRVAIEARYQHKNNLALSEVEVEKLQIVGLLHDLLEDHGHEFYKEYDSIKDVVRDSDIANAIVRLSKVPKSEQRQGFYTTYVQRIAEDQLASAVKMADLQDNMLDLEGSSHRRQKYEMTYILLKNEITNWRL